MSRDCYVGLYRKIRDKMKMIVLSLYVKYEIKKNEFIEEYLQYKR